MRRGVSKVMTKEAQEYAEANNYRFDDMVCHGTRVPEQSAIEDLVDEAIMAGVGK